MSLVIRAMCLSEEEQVAAMVMYLARETAVVAMPPLTAEKLRRAADLLDVTVAEDAGVPLVAFLGLQRYSMWRAARRLDVVDLFVAVTARARGIGKALLRAAAASAMDFIKLEVDLANEGAARFYSRYGFSRKEGERLFVFESEQLQHFNSGKGTS